MSSRIRDIGAATTVAISLLAATAPTTGCQRTREGTPTRAGDAAPGPEQQARPVTPRPAGVPVPGTRVVVPRQATAGARMRIAAPTGSVVRFAGTETAMPAAGELWLDVPPAPGEARLTIDRPDGRRLAFRIDIL